MDITKQIIEKAELMIADKNHSQFLTLDDNKIDRKTLLSVVMDTNTMLKSLMAQGINENTAWEIIQQARDLARWEIKQRL